MAIVAAIREGISAVNWRRKVGQQPDGPFDDPKERQKVRQSVDVTERAEEQKEFWRGLRIQIRRGLLWITAMAGAVVASSQIPDAIAKLLKFFKGVP